MQKLFACCLTAILTIALTGCDPKPTNTEAVPPPTNKDELMKAYGKGGKGSVPQPTAGPGGAAPAAPK